MIGGEDAWPRLSEALQDYRLNGREIKMAIQNAVTRAGAGRER